MPVSSVRRAIAPVPALALAVAALLGGCAHRAAPVAVAETAPPPPRPTLAAGRDGIVPPPRLADGRYATINADIDPQRTVWHLRAALNVAAIGCRAPEDAGIVPAYNALLAGEKRALAAANTSVEASFRAEGGDWRAAHDRYMTRLYNFFAMPAAKAAFCAAARDVAPGAAAAPAEDFTAFAANALPQLEAPFDAVYAAIDDWKVEVAAWDARYGAGATQVAQAEPAPGPIAAAALVTTPPRLAYADMAATFAWAPAAGATLAAR